VASRDASPVLIAVTSSSPKALWYLTRGTGLVSLLLLTVTMVLGLAQPGRFVRPGAPRLLVAALHRNASLLAVGLLTVHIATAVADSYAPIGVVDAFVPFIGAYRPIWLGLGALSLDLMLVLTATSLVRRHLGAGTWRAVHWAAYACWPLAVVHGLGTGSDPRLGWAQVVYVACTLAVLVTLWWRIGTAITPWPGSRQIAVVASSLALTGVVAAWSLAGPLRPGWAQKSRTAGSLLGVAAPGTVAPGTEGRGTADPEPS
jgi:sulfoxide reductase heme-binding subunit YedZ